MEVIRELGFLGLNARDDFTVIKRFFQKEEFGEQFLDKQLELTDILLPELLVGNYDLYERERQKPLQLTLFDGDGLSPEGIEKILKECIIQCKVKR